MGILLLRKIEVDIVPPDDSVTLNSYCRKVPPLSCRICEMQTL